MRKQLVACLCDYQSKKDWGYSLFIRSEPEYWRPLGHGSIETINKALSFLEPKALVKCRGCGAELLREYDD